MNVTFLGTGTSMGVPVAGGFGSEKTGGNSGDPRDQRFRCSAWIETPERSLVIDAGPEFRLQTLRAGIRRIDALLITHEHIDHIGGMDDLRSFNYAQKNPITVYASRRSEDEIRSRYYYMFGPNKTPGSVDMVFKPAENVVKEGDCQITPLPVKHGKMDVLGYRINDFSYITDVSFIPEETAKIIRGSKILVLSGLRWKPPHPAHFTIPEAIEVAEQLQVEKTYLIHMSPYVKHSETTEQLPDNIRLAFDQLQIQL